MRFFKRRSPEPPELVRLCRLPPEEALHHHHSVGGEEGGQPAAFATSAPLVHRAAISRSASPTATLVRLRQQRRECFCGSSKEAMALSSETRGAGGPVDVVSPASTMPRCCFVEATGAARTATPPGSAKLKRAADIAPYETAAEEEDAEKRGLCGVHRILLTGRAKNKGGGPPPGYLSLASSIGVGYFRLSIQAGMARTRGLDRSKGPRLSNVAGGPQESS
ncbi:hypothetical protein HPB50_017682 [Hyalomma asiaticum]|uniref:Uncharacterized protein n=1 Tax=Hyalomma asiaticum TaxID=266040 RepID=A0ACB7SI56_HYAAI|nr:hypothetical protein HPB50_017682 [Hyalomma asiaticum]